MTTEDKAEGMCANELLHLAAAAQAVEHAVAIHADGYVKGDTVPHWLHGPLTSLRGAAFQARKTLAIANGWKNKLTDTGENNDRD